MLLLAHERRGGVSKKFKKQIKLKKLKNNNRKN
jgi:hypothetical protein